MDVPKSKYFNEIKLMMHGFGDSHIPNNETVLLVESITLSQLRMIIQEAQRQQYGAYLRGEELVFLLRKNKYKMRRFVKYLENKALKRVATSNVVDLTTDIDSPPKHKLIEFIEHIDETGELTDVNDFDEVKHERQLRAERISIALNEQQYILFSLARSTNFSSKSMSQIKNYENLRAWIDPNMEITFGEYAMEVLSYFAYETVAQLIDYVLLLRVDNRRISDPISGLNGSFYTSSMFNEHTKDVYTGHQAISISEVKEVMRRIYMPQAGKLTLGRNMCPSDRKSVV